MLGNNRSSRVRNQKNLVDTVERSKSCDTISFVRLSVINNETFGSLFCHRGRVFIHNDYPGGGAFSPFESCPGGGWLMMKLKAPFAECVYTMLLYWNEK